MKAFFKFYLGTLIVIVIGLLLAHTFSIKELKVDNVSIFLIIILILIPFITTIKKFKWGDFEAEIETKEVKEIKKSVDKATSKAKRLQENTLSAKSVGNHTQEEVMQLFDYLIELSDLDPVLAMAKLRVEIEKLIRRIYLFHEGDEKRSNSIGYMIKYLIEKEDFDSQELESAQLIINVSNRVIHGEKIENTDAKIVVMSAAKLLGYMSGYTRGLKLTGKLN